MNDTSTNILLSDVQGQGFLSIFNDLSSELMPHELSLLELMEGLDYNGFDSSLKRDASVDPKDMAIIIIYSYIVRVRSPFCTFLIVSCQKTDRLNNCCFITVLARCFRIV